MKPFKPPTPMATNMLIGMCVAVEAAGLVGGAQFGQRLDFMAGLIPARIMAALAGSTEPLPAYATFITHMFLHAGTVHLALNMLFLAWVGRYVEYVAGQWKLAGLFVAGGVIGSCLQVLVDPTGTAPVIGASGAIAAVFGAYAVLFAKSRAERRIVLGLSVSGEMLTSLWYAAAWIGLQLLTGLVFNDVSGMGGIAIWTHIGGFLAGLVAARLWSNGTRRG